jgi:ribonuclease T2
MSENDFMLLLNRGYSSDERRNRFLLKILTIGFAFIVVFISITLIILSSSPSTKRPKFITNCSVAYEFDFSQLTLRWPPTICNNDQCLKYESNKWLIHGFWPSYNNQSWPQFCCFDRKFDVKNLDPIVSKLESDWPNLEPDKPNDSLWKHEWVKHGTCTKTKQLDYFNNTLHFYQMFPIFEWLQKSNITPSNELTYQMNEFNEVFKVNLKHKVQFNCINRDSKLYLEEILICINHNASANIIDCSGRSNCKKAFYYPKSIN